jgi:hypothetical protein
LLLSMRYARRKKGPVLARSHPKKPARATQCRWSGRRYSHWFAREVVSNLALVAEVGRTADTGSLTLRWREMDSKFQFRDASPPPTAWAPSFRRVSGGSLSRRNSFNGLPSRRPLGRFRRADYHRLQPDRSLETAAYLARNWIFESISLHRRVCCEPVSVLGQPLYGPGTALNPALAAAVVGVSAWRKLMYSLIWQLLMWRCRGRHASPGPETPAAIELAQGRRA